MKKTKSTKKTTRSPRTKASAGPGGKGKTTQRSSDGVSFLMAPAGPKVPTNLDDDEG